MTQLKELAATVLSHDKQIKVISDVLTRLIKPPTEPTPKRRIEFLSADPAS